jgi:hypothetical protein
MCTAGNVVNRRITMPEITVSAGFNGGFSVTVNADNRDDAYMAAIEAARNALAGAGISVHGLYLSDAEYSPDPDGD